MSAAVVTGLAALVPAGSDDDALAVLKGRKGLRTLGRESRLLLAAALEACADAGLDPAQWDPDAVGVFIGSDTAGYLDFAELFKEGLLYGGEGVSPARGPETGFNAPAAHLSIALDARGPNLTVGTGATGGLDAVAMAAQALASGRCRVALAGAVDVVEGRSAAADGLALLGEAGGVELPRGEAAVVVVLEGADHARGRGAAVRARVAGDATMADDPSELGPSAAWCVAEAARRAGVAMDALTGMHVYAGGLPGSTARAWEAARGSGSGSGSGSVKDEVEAGDCGAAGSALAVAAAVRSLGGPAAVLAVDGQGQASALVLAPADGGQA